MSEFHWIKPDRFASHLIFTTLIAVFAVALAGCESKEEIRHYRAPKLVASGEDSGEESEGGQRMLAAIVLQGETAWFFKLVGPDKAVEDHAERFHDFVASLKFVGGDPKWTLPKDWNERPGTGIRYATLKTKSGDTDLEVSVTSLPRPAGDDSEYHLANINRWRGQLQLGPLSLDQLKRESKQVEFDGGAALVIDIVGTASDDGRMSRAPFAGLNPGPRERPNVGASPAALQFDKPDGWSEGELIVSRGGITLRHEAAFDVSDGDEAVEITVDRMPSMGGTLANVNRWRRQIGLSPQDEAAFQQSVQQIEMDGEKRDYVSIVGDDQTILGVIAQQDGQAWYIKLKGDNDLAKAERERFEEFVKSIRFE